MWLKLLRMEMWDEEKIGVSVKNNSNNIFVKTKPVRGFIG